MFLLLYLFVLIFILLKKFLNCGFVDIILILLIVEFWLNKVFWGLCNVLIWLILYINVSVFCIFGEYILFKCILIVGLFSFVRLVECILCIEIMGVDWLVVVEILRLGIRFVIFLILLILFFLSLVFVNVVIVIGVFINFVLCFVVVIEMIFKLFCGFFDILLLIFCWFLFCVCIGNE